MKDTIEQRASKLQDKIIYAAAGTVTKVITEALQAERELAVRECTEAAFKAMGGRSNVAMTTEQILVSQAILAIAKPAAPVWQHKDGCPTPYEWNGNEWMIANHAAQPHARFCDGCGAPKPEVQP